MESKESSEKSCRMHDEGGRVQKRQKIEVSGGVRPRNKEKRHPQIHLPKTNNKKQRHVKSQINNHHRFGQVMDRVPCRNRPRFSTLSIALPGSVLSICQTRELKTHTAGQIARACTLYHVDEIVVFDDKLSKGHHSGDADAADPSCAFLARVLQYCECPQYLRKNFFPRHPDLQLAGVLPPIDAPHHVRAEDRCKYRDGVVIEPRKKDPKSSLVNCGLRSRPIEIDRVLPVGLRCTVQIEPKDYGKPGKKLTGKVVSPATPREDDGSYWGFTTRMANSIHKVFEECPFDGGYDLRIGTSERGNVSLEDPKFAVPKFTHSLIVFGGVAGIEECVDADETSKLPGSESKKLFELWVNICPYQGSRTIRTEEAVLIGLAKLSPYIASSGVSKKANTNNKAKAAKAKDAAAVVDFSSEAISDESSDNGSGNSSSSESE